MRRQIHAHKLAQDRERQAELELLAADPFDIEAQAKIAERIRQAQVSARKSFCQPLAHWKCLRQRDWPANHIN